MSVFLFREKTAYGKSISDLSSDVCSSDLSRTGGSKALAEAAAQGADTAAKLVAADEVTPALLQEAGGYLFVGPENLAALSGAMKEMFDRCYYPCLGPLEGRPYATIICEIGRASCRERVCQYV